MVFSSMVFLLRFLPLVLLVYGICPKPARNADVYKRQVQKDLDALKADGTIQKLAEKYDVADMLKD